MPGDGEQIDVLELTGEVQRELPSGLNGVGMNEGAVGFNDARDLADWLNRAGLVIGEHHADKFRVRTQRGFDVRRIHDAVVVGGEVGDFDSAAFERLGGEEHCVVFDLRRDEMGGFELSFIFRSSAVEPWLQDAGECEVVALCTAGGEDNLFGTAVEERSDGGACVLDGRAGALAGLMRRAGVAVALEPEGAHRLHDFGEDGRSRVGVQVDTHL